MLPNPKKSLTPTVSATSGTANATAPSVGVTGNPFPGISSTRDYKRPPAPGETAQLPRSSAKSPPTTPKGRLQQPLKKPSKVTPRSLNFVSNGNTKDIRHLMESSMKNEFVECSNDDFLNCYMSQISRPSSHELDQIMKKACKGTAKRSPILRPSTRQRQKYEWTKFSMDGGWKIGRENDRFKPLSEQMNDIFTTIQRSRGSDHERGKINYKLAFKPNSGNPAFIPGGTHKMDGYFHETNASFVRGRHPMNSIAVTAEFKKDSEETLVHQNRLQLVSNAVFMMNNDPRRTCVWGITIEGDDCAIWNFNRSHSAKSVTFKWTENPRTFMEYMITFAFSTSEELGFDPAITLLKSPRESYIYQFKPENEENPRCYRTVDTISELRGLCITGRATRVFLAEEIESVENPIRKPNSPNVVLKDVWLPHGAQTEKQTQDAIFEDVEKFKQRMELGEEPPEFQLLDVTGETANKDHIRHLVASGNYKQHFLTIQADYLGSVSPNVPENASRAGDVLRTPIPSEASASNHPSAMGTSRNTESASANPLPQKPAPDRHDSALPRTYHRKQRYFVVLDEVCEAVHEMTVFADAVETLKGGLYGLIILFLAGWVHRDISCGNILRYSKGGNTRGILSDLEYAKRFPSATHSVDPKTGTAFFMPYEILFQVKLQAPTLGRLLAETTRAVPKVKVPDPVILHSFQHDIESFWWLFLWLITTRIPPLDSSAYRFEGPVFDNSANPRDRAWMFTVENKLSTRLTESLHLSLNDLIDPVDNMRGCLVEAYQTLPIPEDGDKFRKEYKRTVSWLFRHMLNIFVLAQRVGSGVPELKPLAPVGGTKRRHNDEAEEQNDVGEVAKGGTPQVKKRVKMSLPDPTDARLQTRPKDRQGVTEIQEPKLHALTDNLMMSISAADESLQNVPSGPHSLPF